MAWDLQASLFFCLLVVLCSHVNPSQTLKHLLGQPKDKVTCKALFSCPFGLVFVYQPLYSPHWASLGVTLLLS